jgi:Holliday junction resolvase
MLYIDSDGLKGLLHFSTYSSARKALQVRKHGSQISLLVDWKQAVNQHKNSHGWIRH